MAVGNNAVLYRYFFFSSRRRHTRCSRDWSSDVCSSDLDARCLELGHLVAHGGELAVSAGGVVSRVEDQRDLFGLQHIGQAVRLAVRRGGGEWGCLAPDHQKLAHEIPLRFLCNVLT